MPEVFCLNPFGCESHKQLLELSRELYQRPPYCRGTNDTICLDCFGNYFRLLQKKHATLCSGQWPWTITP